MVLHLATTCTSGRVCPCLLRLFEFSIFVPSFFVRSSVSLGSHDLMAFSVPQSDESADPESKKRIMSQSSAHRPSIQTGYSCISESPSAAEGGASTTGAVAAAAGSAAAGAAACWSGGLFPPWLPGATLSGRRSRNGLTASPSMIRNAPLRGWSGTGSSAMTGPTMPIEVFSGVRSLSCWSVSRRARRPWWMSS